MWEKQWDKEVQSIARCCTTSMRRGSAFAGSKVKELYPISHTLAPTTVISPRESFNAAVRGLTCILPNIKCIAGAIHQHLLITPLSRCLPICYGPDNIPYDNVSTLYYWMTLLPSDVEVIIASWKIIEPGLSRSEYGLFNILLNLSGVVQLEEWHRTTD